MDPSSLASKSVAELELILAIKKLEAETARWNTINQLLSTLGNPQSTGKFLFFLFFCLYFFVCRYSTASIT